MKLTTKRLILREITAKDIPDLIRNINNVKISRYLLGVNYPYTMKDARLGLNECKRKAKEKPRATYTFCIELKSKKGIIGEVELNHVDNFQGTANIDYWLGEDYWRQGIVSEAVTEVLAFAFKKLKLRRINLYAFAENKGSSAIAKKFGFKFEGRTRKEVRDNATGRIHDANYYGLLKEDWKK